MAIRYLTLAEVMLIHHDQLTRYGGETGLIDPMLLSSALAMPPGSYSGQELHPSLFDKAAAYLFHLCQNHAFVDGNKRVGLAAALVFLDLNGVTVDDPNGELYDLVIRVTAGQAGKPQIAEVLERLSRPTEA
jgi:death-on-curing protein